MQIRRPFALLSVMMILLAQPLAAQDLVPAKRFVLTQDADLPGGDLSTLLDTTIESCERACMADQSCTHFTFNSRNGSCFTKQNPGEGAFYQGAFSGHLVANDPQVLAAAKERRAELGFLSDGEITEAHNQAVDLANRHTSGSWTDEEHLATAAEREAQGDLIGAVNFAGAAVNVSDKPEIWVEYARLLTDAAQNSDNSSDLRSRAIQAAINGYLRASNKAVRHNALVQMARAMEAYGRGADAVKALRLAQKVQSRDETAALLEDYAGKYGFRILESDIQSDTARPRVCVNVSENLVESGLDYTPFVQLPETGLTVQPGGWRQLCIEGVQHGKRYQFTFREGLPSADGQELAKSVQISAYVRDRQPGVRFSGRAYMLPKSDAAALPVVTVNTETLDLALFRVSDRSILRAVQNGYLSWPIAEYQESGFTDDIGERLWTGTATVAQEVNKDVTTRLPMGEALKDLKAGIYAVKATVPGVDPYEIPAAWQWFVVSDLGVTSLSGTDGLHVIVRSLASADAKAGVTVELLSRTNNVLGTAVTDDKGYARFDAGLTRGTGGGAPAMLVAKEGEGDLAFLSLTDPEFDLSDRGVEGREAAGPIDVFLTTDRGAYRAGETVYATALTRDPQANAIEGLPLTAIFKRPDGVEYARMQANDAGKGGHVFAQPIAGSAPRGVWRMEVYADLQAKPLTSQTFLVEDFLPERIDFTMTLPDTPLRLGDIAELEVEAKYLFGAPGGDLAVEGDVLLRAAKELPGLPGYIFGRHDQPFDARMESFAGGSTDAAGRANIGAILPEVDDPGRPLEARITLRIAEGSGRPVERRIEKVLTPSRAMIGVKPLFDGEVPENGDARFALQGIGADISPEPMKVAWELTRVQTDYQWYSYSGNWNWEPVTTRTRIANGEADLGSSPVEVGAPVQWGEYELAVSRIDGTPAETSTSFYAGWYAPADATATPDTLELSLDKPAYRPGETAKLRLVPRAAGTALVMVMADRLVSMQAVEVSEGENLIDLPVTDDWGAGVYVTASVLRPMDVAAGRNPARALGLAHAAIDPGAAKLAVAVQAPAESAPRAPLDVAIKVDGVAMGDTAYVTVAAVDVGILNLTGFKSPDPAGYYFGQRKLGMGIRDVYGRLIDGLNGAEGQVRSGGDAGAQARLQAPPPTEELVAYFTGPVEVGADGLAKVSFDLPAFNGTVKVMAVAWSGKAVGQADAEILVRDPVVVTASLPRFMAPGDDSRLLLEVVHATGPAGRMKLAAQSEGGVTLGEMPGEIDLGEKQKTVLTVPVHADQAGLGKITVTLTTPDGKDLVKTLMLPVESGEPEIARISRFDLTKGQEFTFDANVFDGFMPGTSKATLAVGPIARLNAPGLLEALDRYPYGCTEQMTSRALPLVYFDQVAQVMQLKGAENISLRIEQSVTEILQNQNSEGSFGLWQAPESSGGDLWLDAYVTDFLSRARAQGYKVPDLAFRNALDNLRNQVNYYSDFDDGGQDLAYALLVLAREGAAAVGDLRYYADVKGEAFATALAQAQIGAALASYGDPTRADAMFRKAMARLDAAKPETAQIYRADYGTDLRDSAAVLTLAVEAGSEAVNRDALIARISTNGAMSTQESVWTLLASNALIDGAGADITMNGEAVTGPLVRVMSDGTAPTVVRNNGANTFLTVTAYGVPSEPLSAGGNGYAITRSYYTLEGEAASLEDLKVGTRLVAVLEVTPFDRGEARLIVADPLPAGFEIDNPNLIGGGDVSGLDWLGLQTDAEHSEFRQDRFVTAVDRHDNAPFRLAYIVRAVSPGTFTHPAASVEDMYRPSFRAQSGTGRITIAQ